MATHCFIPVLGKRIRVTALDNCGAFPAAAAADAQLATDGFITATLSAEVEDGTEIIVRKASGALCVNEQQASSFKRFTLEIEFCGVNPSLVGMVSNAVPYLDWAGDVAGFTVPEGEITKKFAFELWTGLSGQACAPGAEEAGGYLLLPFVQSGVLGDVTIDGENAVTFSLTGAFTKGGNAWGVGPYDVVFDTSPAPAQLPEALDPLDHLLLLDTGLAPPPSACDPGPMPAYTMPVAATGATAGVPGTWTPALSSPPADAAEAEAEGIIADPLTLWTVGQYVQGSTAGAPGQMHWDGDSWASGVAPA